MFFFWAAAIAHARSWLKQFSIVKAEDVFVPIQQASMRALSLIKVP